MYYYIINYILIIYYILYIKRERKRETERVYVSLIRKVKYTLETIQGSMYKGNINLFSSLRTQSYCMIFLLCVHLHIYLNKIGIAKYTFFSILFLLFNFVT